MVEIQRPYSQTTPVYFHRGQFILPLLAVHTFDLRHAYVKCSTYRFIEIGKAQNTKDIKMRKAGARKISETV